MIDDLKIDETHNVWLPAAEFVRWQTLDLIRLNIWEFDEVKTYLVRMRKKSGEKFTEDRLCMIYAQELAIAVREIYNTAGGVAVLNDSSGYPSFCLLGEILQIQHERRPNVPELSNAVFTIVTEAIQKAGLMTDYARGANDVLTAVMSAALISLAGIEMARRN